SRLRRAARDEDFGRLPRLTLEDGDIAALRDIEGAQVAFAVEQTRDRAAGGRDACEVDVAAFFEHEQHAGAVRRELRPRDVAIEPGREDLRDTTRRRNDGDVVGRVP